MKRYSIFFMLMIAAVCARADVVRKVTVNDNTGVTAVYYNGDVECAREVFDKDSNLVRRTGSIPDGVVKQFAPNGTLVGEFNYKNDRKNGSVKKFSEGGRLRQEMSYKAGRKSGATKDYFNNGNLSQESMYENGKLNGVTKVYTADGKLFEEITYANDVREGLCTTFFESGRPGEVSLYKAGKKDGITKVYFDTELQQLQYAYTYHDGELIKTVEYNPDGTLKAAPGIPAR